MRLIDADKIRYSDMSDGQVPGGLWYTFKETIDKTPTVEAIPIEWIKEHYGWLTMACEIIKDWEAERGADK